MAVEIRSQCRRSNYLFSLTDGYSAVPRTLTKFRCAVRLDQLADELTSDIGEQACALHQDRMCMKLRPNFGVVSLPIQKPYTNKVLASLFCVSGCVQL